MKKGFTLIELLVVVLIIGILAAIALPQYTKAVAKSRITEAVVIGDSLKEAQERYYLQSGKYTMLFNDLDIEIPATATASAGTSGPVSMATKNFNFTFANSPQDAMWISPVKTGTLPGLVYYYDNAASAPNYRGALFCLYTVGTNLESICKSLSSQTPIIAGTAGRIRIN
ncbi:type IV pilus assembly protein PilE [Elusimicrobium posterum]|uniref:type IV pilin protein n=1 Tax=Elusimicrobium posterum TaxID=3116653 RepID=UPI003C77E86E